MGCLLLSRLLTLFVNLVRIKKQAVIILNIIFKSSPQDQPCLLLQAMLWPTIRCWCATATPTASLDLWPQGCTGQAGRGEHTDTTPTHRRCTFSTPEPDTHTLLPIFCKGILLTICRNVKFIIFLRILYLFIIYSFHFYFIYKFSLLLLRFFGPHYSFDS